MKPLTIEHYDSDENGNEVTYIIVEPTYDPGERQTYQHPGCPPSVDFDKAYLKGDPEETDIFEGAYPKADSPLNSLFDRIEATIFEYFDGRLEQEQEDRAEAYYDDQYDKLNG